MNTIKFCAKCGAPIGPEQKFCGGCGASIAEMEAEAGISTQQAAPAQAPVQQAQPVQQQAPQYDQQYAQPANNYTQAAAPAAAGSGGTGARGRAVLPCGRGDAAGGAAGCDPNVSAGTRQRPPSGFSQAAECFPGTGDADPAAAGGAGGADSHGAALHAAKREIAGYDCWNY